VSSESISFDRAASYYDRTRAVDGQTMKRLTAMLATELAGSGRVLEAGIGTGRIALPLISKGVAITGIDISRPMLERLREKAGPHVPPLAIADATRLPFRDRTFDACIASHLLHLVPGWRDAVGEMLRVVRPGGLVLASRGGRNFGSDWWHELRRRFFAVAGSAGRPPGLDRIEELDEEMVARGVAVTHLPAISDSSSASVNDLIRMMEEGIWSACWSIDEDTRRRAAAVTKEWAADKLGDLDAPRLLGEELAWRSYRLP
jgi:SAM-dependent methyltransferase